MNPQSDTQKISIPGLIDLAAERVGGRAELASDEFFGPKETLLKPGRGIWLPEEYTERGKWVDGWETRRKRDPGYDWCLIRLGLPGMVRLVDVDTNHFLGNHPACASLEGCQSSAETTAEKLIQEEKNWSDLFGRTPLQPGSRNFFPVSSTERTTHIRLNIFPDGGVARLRVYGTVVPDWERVNEEGLADLVALANGGRAITASDTFFSSAENLILPGESIHMGDGWETKRRRAKGHDWAVLKTGRPGIVKRLEISTRRFKGNYPARCSVDGSFEPRRPIDPLNVADLTWEEILPPTALQGDTVHVFTPPQGTPGPMNFIRLNTYPDGGISRFRVLGHWEGG